MITKAAVLKLVMLVCMDSECVRQDAYEVDTFQGVYLDAMEDCRKGRDDRRKFYRQHGIAGVEFHCWTPAELKREGF